nr:ribonuclease H-like domain-containing protein [Tanacetum cinerariifolium]
MLKQEFSKFSVSEEEEGLHKGYDRFQKILSQLNQMQAKPDNDDVNMKFLRALPPSLSQVSLTLKTRGGLEYLSFDDLYNKLRSLEIDVKGGSSYGSRGTTVALTHSSFIGAASTNTKMVYSDQPIHSSLITYTSAHSGSIMEDVLHLFVAKNKLTQQLAYEDFKQVDEKARYSAFKVLGVKTEEPKAMVFIDSMSDFADHAAGSVYDAAAEFSMMRISPKDRYHKTQLALEEKVRILSANDSFIQVQAYKNTVKTLELQKDRYHKTQLALEEKVRILSANLENTTNTLKYSETLYDQDKIEKKEWEVKLVELLAKFDKWKESSKNLAKLINSSMSTRTKHIGSNEVFDRSTPSVFDHKPKNKEVKSLYERFVKAGEMHEVPPPITGTFMPTSYKSDLEETQVTFGSKSNTSSINTSESNDFVKDL